jgi:hypothetical protein
MTTRFRDLSGVEYWNLAWPFILSCIVGVIFRILAPRVQLAYGPPEDVVAALADALLVAGIVGLLLELFASRLFIENIARDISEKLVGRGLPPELQSHIREIVNTSVVRDRYVKTYKLSPPDASGHVQIDLNISFDVKNYSDSVQHYSPTFAEEIFYHPEFLSLQYGLPGQQPRIDFDEETNTVTKVKTIKGKHEVKLEPFRSNERALCEVKMRYRITMPEEYSDVTSFGGATVGATLLVENMPQGMDVVSIGETTSTSNPNGDKSWYFDRPFVTNQHIRVWWFKKRGVTPSASQT